MSPAVPVSWDGSNFRPRPHRTVVKNLSIMLPVLPDQRIRRAHALPTVVPHRPVPTVLLLLVLPVRMARRPVRPDQVVLAARAVPDVRVAFRAPVVLPALVVQEVVLVVRLARVALVVQPVVLAALPVRV